MLTYIIPYYNGDAFVPRLIDSIFCQSQIAEVIVVDDGSKSVSFDSLSVKDIEKIKVISQDNAGVNSARNNGLKNCKTELVCFVDQDDFIIGDHCKAVCDLYDGKSDLMIALAATGNDELINLSAKNKYGKFSSANKLAAEFIGDNCVQTSTFIWSRRFLEKIGGFDENFVLFDDNELALRAFSYSPVVQLIEPNAWVVWYDHSTPSRGSHNNGPRRAFDNVQYDLKLLELFSHDSDLKKLIIKRCYRDGKSVFLNGYTDFGMSLIGRSLELGYSPSGFFFLLNRLKISIYFLRVGLLAKRSISRAKKKIKKLLSRFIV